MVLQLRSTSGAITEYAETSLPQTISGIADGTYYIRRVALAENVTPVIIAAEAATMVVGLTDGVVTISGVTGTEVEITVTGDPNHNGTYSFDTADLAAGPLILSPPGFIGDTDVDDTVAATQPLVVGRADHGIPIISWQWLRNDSAISGATGLTYTVIAFDADYGIKVKASATNAAGTVSATAVVIAQPGFTKSSVLVPASTGLYGSVDLATNVLVFASFTVAQIGASSGILRAVLGMHSNAYAQIEVGATGALSLRLYLGSAGMLANPSPNLVAGDQVEVLLFARPGYARGVFRINGGAPVLTGTNTSTDNTLPHTGGQVRLGRGNSAVGANIIHRAAIFTNVPTLTVDDSAIQNLFWEPGGDLKNPSISWAALGAPPVEKYLNAATWNDLENEGTGVDFTKSGTGTFTDV